MKYFYGWYSCNATMKFGVEDMLWCKDQFGEDSYTGRWFYSSTANRFYFKREDDATWFLLRWS